MRLLAALVAGSGLAWIAGFVALNPSLLDPAAAPILVIAACCVAVGAGLVLTARHRRRLTWRLVVLWAVTAVVPGLVLAPVEFSLPALGASLLYGTIAFLLWMAPPLLIFSFVSTVGRRPPDR